MADSTMDPRTSIDARVNSPSREGLTGTAPADLYGSAQREQITIPPDFGPLDAQPEWRQDFPIDWPQDTYVERRDFVKFLVLVSFAMTAGQVWVAVQSWLRRQDSPLPGVRIAASSEVPVGGSMRFLYPGEHDPCLLVRLQSNELVAFSQKCTHLSCAVIPKPEQSVFHCPCHNGFFDIRTGAPAGGPPTRPLPRIVLDVRGDDVFAVGVETRTD